VGKKTTKTKSESTPWAPAQPYILGAANDIQNIVKQNQPNLQALQGSLTGSIIPGLQQQMQNTGAQLQPGYDYVNATLGGKYLNSNPYTQAMAKQAGQAAANQVNTDFSAAGRTGSGNHATDLARGVDQAQNAVLFQNYQNERSLQNQALGALPGMTTAQYAGYQPLLAATQLAGQLPYYGASAESGIGNLFGGYGTTTGTQPGGWGNTLGGILGAGLGGWASGGFALPSDRRLKTNIKLIRRAKDGLGEYEWNWKADPDGETVRGVIADEVEKLRPWAFIPNFKGDYAGVNYAALGSLA
jgi:hypothetical protein